MRDDVANQPSQPSNTMAGLDLDAGDRMMRLATDLFPVARSLTGPGVRQSLERLGRDLPLRITEVPTGTQVFDWTIPQEWRVLSATLHAPGGQLLADWGRSNLHLMHYSRPFEGRLSLADLRPHLFGSKLRRDALYYRTSFFQENWGFSLPQNQIDNLTDGEYAIDIRTEFVDGSLTYGEAILPGNTNEEILFSAHICHPSLANDNLSGIVIATELFKYLEKIPNRRYTYRFLFAPATLGAIAWLALNEPLWPRIRAGLVLALLGDAGPSTYKRSWHGSLPIDSAMAHVLKQSGTQYQIRDYSPYGYDERQFGSPGIRLPLGSLFRSPYMEFQEYHTSDDNLSFISAQALADSLEKIKAATEILENNSMPRNLSPKGEPRLGPRGLYAGLRGRESPAETEMAVFWVLNQADGQNSLLSIADRSGLPFKAIHRAAVLLEECGLMELSPLP